MEMKNPDQEIDLMELLAKFYRTLRRNVLLTIICPVLGIIIGLFLHNFSPKILECNMMIVTDLISENECSFLLEQLKKADTLDASKFNFEMKKGEQINNENITNPYFSTKPIYFQITTVTNDRATLEDLQTSVISFINSSDPVVRNRNEKEKFFNEMIKKLDLELASLEKVKEEFNNKTKATFLEPSSIFTKSVELYEKKIIYQWALKDIKSVHVLKGFETPTQMEKPSILLFGFFGMVAGVFVLVFILFINFFRKYYKQFTKTI